MLENVDFVSKLVTRNIFENMLLNFGGNVEISCKLVSDLAKFLLDFA